MSVTHVVGVDPGLVHTGVVEMVFRSGLKTVEVRHMAVPGPDAREVCRFAYGEPLPHIFIEKYQPRSHLNTDAAMNKAVLEMKQALPGAQVLLNTGVKKVVRQPLMELLGVWKFSTRTHHQDLRSAARIAILGMMKDEQMNRLLADVVRDAVEGVAWDVRHRS